MEIVAQLKTILEKESIDTRTGAKDKQILIFSEQIQKKDGDTFEKLYAVEFFGDKVGYLSQYNVGDTCKLTIDVSSRHWKDDKYFTSISGRFIDKVETAEPINETGQPEPETQGTDPDDIPF